MDQNLDIVAAVNERAQRARAWLAADPFLAAVEPGHLREAAGLYLGRGGKGLRPALVMMACGAVGGEEDWALAAAAAAEVTHNWTLVHDDIIDRDDRRRGQPSAHAALATRGHEEFGLAPAEAAHYGLTMAILGGDVGPSWAAHLLTRLPENGATSPETACRLAAELATVTVPAILAGEAEDVRLSRARLGELGVERIEEMLARKTGALYEWCARAGAAVGTAKPNGAADAIGSFARLCGTAFQHVDDTLPYVADEKLMGKPSLSDLREGKRTAAVIAAYDRASAAERRFIADTLGGAGDDALIELRGIIMRLGGVEFARERAGEFHRRALTHLDALAPGRYRDMLAAWADYLVFRKY